MLNYLKIYENTSRNPPVNIFNLSLLQTEVQTTCPVQKNFNIKINIFLSVMLTVEIWTCCLFISYRLLSPINMDLSRIVPKWEGADEKGDWDHLNITSLVPGLPAVSIIIYKNFIVLVT
jgi:hypothetical protein